MKHNQALLGHKQDVRCSPKRKLFNTLSLSPSTQLEWNWLYKMGHKSSEQRHVLLTQYKYISLYINIYINIHSVCMCVFCVIQLLMPRNGGQSVQNNFVSGDYRLDNALSRAQPSASSTSHFSLMCSICLVSMGLRTRTLISSLPPTCLRPSISCNWAQ